jgi:tungstate transport system ATP-binding protein
MALIEVSGLGQTSGGSVLLEGISLSIDRGDSLALIGPTGAGKTTLFRLLALLDTPATGSIRIDGTDVTRSERRRLPMRRRMAFVHQKPVVFDRSVFDNVACALQWRRMSKEMIRPRVIAALERVGLARHMDRRARTLSGGETQRVALARALVTEPEILLLDEPTANLDTVSAARIETLLHHIIDGHRTTLLFSTHDFPQGHRLAETIDVLIGGRILQTGSPAEVFTSPENREVAEFVGVENILTGIIRSKEGDLVMIEIDGHTIEAISDLRVGDAVDALVRPEDITFTLSSEATSARNVFRGTIARLISEGSLVRIIVDCGFPLQGILTSSSTRDLELSVGKSVLVNFKATAIHIIRRET